MHQNNLKKIQIETNKIIIEVQHFFKDFISREDSLSTIFKQITKYQQEIKALESNLEDLIKNHTQKSLISSHKQADILLKLELLIKKILKNLDIEEDKRNKEIIDINTLIFRCKNDISETVNIPEEMNQFLIDSLTEIKQEINVIIDEELNKVNTQLFIFFNIQQNELDKKDAIENILKKGEFKFNTEHEAKNTLREIASKMDKSIKEVFDVVTTKINEKFKNIMPEINKYFTQELSSFLNKELIESIYIKTLQLKLTSLSSHDTITLNDTITTQPKLSTIMANFIGTTRTHQEEDDKVYLVKKTDIEQKLGLEFKKLSEGIKKNLLDSYNQSIKETVSFSKDDISNKMEEYRKSKENLLEVYEIDKSITSDEAFLLEQKIKKIKKLNQRIIDTKNILETINV